LSLIFIILSCMVKNLSVRFVELYKLQTNLNFRHEKTPEQCLDSKQLFFCQWFCAFFIAAR
jgi:hypothetical protein